MIAALVWIGMLVAWIGFDWSCRPNLRAGFKGGASRFFAASLVFWLPTWLPFPLMLDGFGVAPHWPIWARGLAYFAAAITLQQLVRFVPPLWTLTKDLAAARSYERERVG